MMMMLLFACAGLFIQPEEGTYVVQLDDVDMDSACENIWGFELEDELELEVDLGKNSMELNDEIECELDGTFFDCSYEAAESIDDYDATVTTEQEMEGSWTSNTTFLADVSVVFGCLGSDCGDLSTDCVIEMTWDAELD
ncbi:MAG: hypothetical protein ACK4YP_26210 [Myxococcota bacterium]